jgi:nicotinamidase-related amidase
VTGSETDVCESATIMSAVDHGFRVILVRDGVCSSSDEGHGGFIIAASMSRSKQQGPRKS